MTRPTPPLMPVPTLLRIDASARHRDSVSRDLTDALIGRLQAEYGDMPMMHRDLGTSPLPFVDDTWVNANFTAPESRTRAQRDALQLSDTLVDELRAADILVIGMPLYNFGIPAALKAWIDMVARARLTFRYTDTGVEGLLTGKRAYLVFASGGVPAGSPVDFATGYMQHVLGFIGITDVTVVSADQLSRRGDAAIADAHAQIAELAITARNVA